MTDKVKKLPKNLRIEITYDKKTSTYFSRCIDDPEIHSIATSPPRLISSLNAVIYDKYGLSKREARSIGDKYILIKPRENILQRFKQGIETLGASSSPKIFDLSTMFPDVLQSM